MDRVVSELIKFWHLRIFEFDSRLSKLGNAANEEGYLCEGNQIRRKRAEAGANLSEATMFHREVKDAISEKRKDAWEVKTSDLAWFYPQDNIENAKI